MRGEHSHGFQPCHSKQGSPPHARGARVPAQSAVNGRGITPACAGSTRTWAARDDPARDHPRMRGEHEKERADLLERRGSPPHARGARISQERDTGPRWITPACAGSTPLWSAAITPARDHPRMRGEHGDVPASSCHCLGSPPHARGAPPEAWPGRRGSGITPACAGSTCHGAIVCQLGTDHPRMRGEHSYATTPHPIHGGSPPHARGAPPPSPGR